MTITSKYEVAAAWANIVLERWIRNIIRLKVIDTGELLRSLQHQVEIDSNGDPQKITFAFVYYGIFPEMGVGKGIKYGEESERKKKPWYSKQMMREVNIFGRIMAEMYGEQAVDAMRLIETKKNNV